MAIDRLFAQNLASDALCFLCCQAYRDSHSAGVHQAGYSLASINHADDKDAESA